MSRVEKGSNHKSSSKHTSLASNDNLPSASSGDNLTVEFRQRTQLTYLLSMDIVQSSASFIYPDLKIISFGYYFHCNNPMENNSIYMYSNSVSSNEAMPFVFLGSEYFFRKPVNFLRLKYPLSIGEHIEPLVDLFLNRPQFKKEIPKLNDLSLYLSLPKSISALLFFDTIFNQSGRHLCYELRAKENYNKFTLNDLLCMVQRENNIIQMNALNDKRYLAFKDQLTDVYVYRSSASTVEKQWSSMNLARESIKIKPLVLHSVPHKNQRRKTRSSLLTTALS